jgi:IclR family acetate operon transcriptional repressor
VTTIGTPSNTGQEPGAGEAVPGRVDATLNQSVRKAVAVLRAAAATPGGDSVSGIARTTALPRATVLRLIRTLEDEGLLVRFPERDRVVPGLELVRLARSVDVRDALVEASRRPLETLAEQTRETVSLSIVETGGTLDVVRQIDPPSLLRISDWIGRRYALHASSSGKLLLSSLGEAQLAAALAGPLERLTPATITDAPTLRRELDAVRETGVAIIVDELELGVASLSVGVRVRDRLAAVLNVTGPTHRFDEAARTAAAPLALEAAAAIERAFEQPTTG